LIPRQKLIPCPLCRGVGYYPQKEYGYQIPVSALFLFLAAPLVYAGFNSLTVPSIDSMDTVCDIHTRKPKSRKAANSYEDEQLQSTLPEICDLDPATLIWYTQNEK
jgi:hypothetical protein